MKNSGTAVALLICFALLGGCATRSQSGKVYTQQQSRIMHTVLYGTVLRAEPVTIEGTQSGLGTVGGGVAGGILGSTIGGGKGSALAAVGGVIAGAVVGSLAEKEVTARQALEIEVQIDGGGILLIVQEADESFAVGDRVRVVKGGDGTARVRH